MARATIGGYTILEGDVNWAQKSGVRPSESDFTLQPQDADNLLAGKLRPLSLEFETPDAEALVIRNLYVIEERPAEDPKTKVVRVVDRRWFWNSNHVLRRYNMRRHVGIKRVKGGANRPEADPLVPEVAYQPWSLNNGQPWTASDALRDAFDEILNTEEETTGSRPTLNIDSDISKLGEGDLPLENVEVDDPGDAAIQRILSFIPGAEVTVDKNGSVRVFSIASGKESGIVSAMGAEQEDGGHIEFIKNRRIRPRRVDILFSPEIELRADFDEPAGSRATSSRNSDDRYIENVLPVPDFSLELFSSNETVAQGTWITITEALNSWGVLQNFGRLDYEIIRRGLVPYMSLFQGLAIAGQADGDADWGSRLAAVQQHFRRTYRLNPRVMERLLSIKDYRVATIDPTTGTRAPAVVYSDWSVVASERYLSVQVGGGGNEFTYATTFPGGGGKETSIDSETRSAPARVSIVDSDQGIIRFDYLVDENRVQEQIIPGGIDNIPTGKIVPGGVISWNSGPRGSPVPELSSEHKASTILTVIPGSPNSDAQLFRVKKTPSDIAGLLPDSLKGGITQADGPVLEVRIGPAWETARIAWVDTDKDRIDAALGLAGQTFAPTEGAGGPQTGIDSLADLVINLGDQAGVGDSGASLDAISNAVAASIYAGFADRFEGKKTTRLFSARDVEGYIQQMLHKVLPSGETTTEIKIADRPRNLGFESFLGTSTRRNLFKLAQPGKT